MKNLQKQISGILAATSILTCLTMTASAAAPLNISSDIVGASMTCQLEPVAAALDNQNSVSFIKQGRNTCKATSVAMCLNLITGSNTYTTAKCGNANCASIQGKSYTGSDGRTYTAAYRGDSYKGSYAEEKNALVDSLNNGAPAVAAVHATNGKHSQHHWVVVVGRSGNDFLIVDPVKSGSGSISNNVRTMSSCGYDLGLADYSPYHYGYITFKASGSSSSNRSSQTNTPQTSSSGCFKSCSGSCNTITAGLKNIGVNSSYAYRKQIAAANGIGGYKGTASQNTQMLQLLKSGNLRIPDGGSSAPVSANNTSGASYFSPCSSSCKNITQGLQNIGENTSYSFRKQIANANNISGYRGTASQNTQMLNLLKQGALKRP